MINTISPIAFNGLVPLKKYKGPMLKLTQAEESKIADLRSNINDMEIELYQINKFLEGKKLTQAQTDYYFNKIDIINTRMRELKQIIRRIKINSLKTMKN